MIEVFGRGWCMLFWYGASIGVLCWFRVLRRARIIESITI